MSCMCVLQSGQFGDGWVCGSILCLYDVRSGDLFVLSCASVRRVSRVSVCSVVLMSGALSCRTLLFVRVRR